MAAGSRFAGGVEKRGADGPATFTRNFAVSGKLLTESSKSTAHATAVRQDNGLWRQLVSRRQRPRGACGKTRSPSQRFLNAHSARIVLFLTALFSPTARRSRSHRAN